MESGKETRVIEELEDLYRVIKGEIEEKVLSFERLWFDGTEEEVYKELVFCLLTPQSKAEWCWDAVERLYEDGLLFYGDYDEILPYLKGIRFKNRKAAFIIESRELFFENGRLKIKDVLKSMADAFILRDWLASNVKGMGYKEASHFLRNIGLGKDLAILDRHVLRGMIELGIVEKVPKSLSKSAYLKLERALSDFSLRISIPMAHLDFLFWYRTTGRIFK